MRSDRPHANCRPAARVITFATAGTPALEGELRSRIHQQNVRWLAGSLLTTTKLERVGRTS